MLDINKYKESKLPHVVSEVICVRCFERWYAVRPAETLLKDMICLNCLTVGGVIETGEILEGE